ncbi:MAG: bifunctional adenosylcobinamide kinase/adenosylcobinamide-phosphate guanylyltransferase [Tissierellia bacterium]|nr:bifunctional adenosylcobinamide kinase/adenosylcobinamide-phosphate guanylyltransferase [Tissierellia bacterium]
MIVLFVGGARSGKSRLAEDFFHGRDDVCYIATARVEDDEMAERVSFHRDMRNKSWRTAEANYNLYSLVGMENGYILDCLTVLSSNIMFDITKDFELDRDLANKVELEIKNELSGLVEEIKKKKKTLVIVTNEVGMSIVPENKLSRYFRDIQGRVNQFAAKLSDEVYLVVAGEKVKIK